LDILALAMLSQNVGKNHSPWTSQPLQWCPKTKVKIILPGHPDPCNGTDMLSQNVRMNIGEERTNR